MKPTGRPQASRPRKFNPLVGTTVYRPLGLSTYALCACGADAWLTRIQDDKPFCPTCARAATRAELEARA